MSRPNWVTLALLAVLLVPGHALAQMTIEGRVRTEDGARLPEHIRVNLLGDMYQQIKDTYLDPSGRFRFETVSMTCYIEIEAGGTDYQTQRVRIDPNPNPYAQRGRETVYREILLKLRDDVRRERSGAPVGPKIDVFAQAVPPPAREAYQKGAASLEKKDYAAAVASLKQALELYPDYYDALEALGTEEARQKNYEEAIPHLRRAVLVNEKGWKSHYALGVALVDSQQREEGLHELRKSVELNPTSLNSNMRLGMELAKDPKTYPEAVSALLKVTQQAGKDVPDAYFFLASVYNKQGKYKESADALEAYLAAVPDADRAQREQYKKIIQQLRSKAANPQ